MQLTRAVAFVLLALSLGSGVSHTAAASPAAVKLSVSAPRNMSGDIPDAHFMRRTGPVVLVDQKSGNLHHSKRRQHRLGYRGHPTYRPGYRWYDGWWYPPDAFLFGFNIVPPPREIIRPPLELAPPEPVPYFAPDTAVPAPSNADTNLAHLHWCDQRYRSYRASDNSFQPYKGPRKACRSPFGP